MHPTPLRPSILPISGPQSAFAALLSVRWPLASAEPSESPLEPSRSPPGSASASILALF